MWNSKQPWWSRKAKDNNPAENSHYKNWCVIRLAVGVRHDPNKWQVVYDFEYKATAKINAPHRYGKNGRLVAEVEVDNLTKHEAHCVAKGLNFLDKE